MGVSCDRFIGATEQGKYFRCCRRKKKCRRGSTWDKTDWKHLEDIASTLGYQFWKIDQKKTKGRDNEKYQVVNANGLVPCTLDDSYQIARSIIEYEMQWNFEPPYSLSSPMWKAYKQLKKSSDPNISEGEVWGRLEAFQPKQEHKFEVLPGPVMFKKSEHGQKQNNNNNNDQYATDSTETSTDEDTRKESSIILKSSNQNRDQKNTDEDQAVAKKRRLQTTEAALTKHESDPKQVTSHLVGVDIKSENFLFKAFKKLKDRVGEELYRSIRYALIEDWNFIVKLAEAGDKYLAKRNTPSPPSCNSEDYAQQQEEGESKKLSVVEAQQNSASPMLEERDEIDISGFYDSCTNCSAVGCDNAQDNNWQVEDSLCSTLGRQLLKQCEPQLQPIDLKAIEMAQTSNFKMQKIDEFVMDLVFRFLMHCFELHTEQIGYKPPYSACAYSTSDSSKVILIPLHFENQWFFVLHSTLTSTGFIVDSRNISCSLGTRREIQTRLEPEIGPVMLQHVELNIEKTDGCNCGAEIVGFAVTFFTHWCFFQQHNLREICIGKYFQYVLVDHERHLKFIQKVLLMYTAKESITEYNAINSYLDNIKSVQFLLKSNSVSSNEDEEVLEKESFALRKKGQVYVEVDKFDQSVLNWKYEQSKMMDSDIDEDSLGTAFLE